MRASKTIYTLGGIFLVFGLVLLLSWNLRPSMTLSEFNEFYKSAEYPVQYSRSLGGYEVKVKLRPNEYHFQQMAGSDVRRTDSLLNANDSVIFFDMKISANGTNSPLFEGDQELLERRLMYFLSFISEDLLLEDGDHACPLINHHVERNFNITNSVNIQLAFRRPKNANFTFVYNDEVLGLGPVKMSVDDRDIKKLPKINF